MAEGKVICGRCAQEMVVEQGTVDEESGQWLCPMCAAEADSCGCSGEDA